MIFSKFEIVSPVASPPLTELLARLTVTPAEELA
jgi:hypothetical protein